MKMITLYLGLDVHKDSITIALAPAGLRNEVPLFGTITNELGTTSSRAHRPKGDS